MSTHRDSNQNKCKGCLLDQSRARKFCYFLNTKTKKKCPCLECLVKMMCVERTTCELRIKAIKSVAHTAYSETAEQLKQDLWI